MQQNQQLCLLKIGLLIVANIFQFQGVLWHYFTAKNPLYYSDLKGYMPVIVLFVLFLQIRLPGHGYHSSVTSETSVEGPSSDNWKTPAATWSTSNRSSTTMATLVLVTSDSTKQNNTHSHTSTYTHTQGFLPLNTFSPPPPKFSPPSKDAPLANFCLRDLGNQPPHCSAPLIPPQQGFHKTKALHSKTRKKRIPKRQIICWHWNLVLCPCPPFFGRKENKNEANKKHFFEDVFFFSV